MKLGIYGLTQSYTGFTLGPITLRIDESIVGLIGANGAGKTTCLTALAGISQTATGTVKVDDVEINKLDRLRTFAFLQHRDVWYNRLTLRAHLEFIRSFYPGWSDEIESALMKRFQFDLDKRADMVSKGALLKFSLLIALARCASVLLLDEPWNDLDPPSRIELSEQIREIRDEHSAIFIISSHDLSELEPICDRFVMLSDGQVVSDESREQIVVDGTAIRRLKEKFARDAHA